jgi:hypothetical protein
MMPFSRLSPAGQSYSIQIQNQNQASLIKIILLTIVTSGTMNEATPHESHSERPRIQ